jgi:hypothetical protein
MNLQSSTLKNDESGRPFHVQQAEQIRIFREAWKAAGHGREPRVSVSREFKTAADNSPRNRTECCHAEPEQARPTLFGDPTLHFA